MARGNSEFEDHIREDEREKCLTKVKDRIDTRLNNVLCEMKDGWDDSIVGFNDAWDEVRKIFTDELSK